MRLLVFAPHPDDEILGCTALLALAQEQKASVKVVIVTSGSAGGDPQARAAESVAGLAVLQMEPPDFWNEPDGALPVSGEIRERYRAIVKAWQPDHIALPATSENHPDHRRLTRGLLETLTQFWSGELLFYETTSPMPLSNRLEPVDIERKLQALACHASQLAQYDYALHARGLASLRGASAGTTAAEAYLSYSWDGSPQNFFEQRELVSVIVRADDRQFLASALASIAAQTYDHTEVVVVWHGDAPLPQGHPLLDCRVLQGPGSRSANLNAGLREARGAYIAFLDQDDLWLPEHLALLLTELRADPLLDIAYGDHVVTFCRREADGRVLVLERGSAQGEDYRPGRLLTGNHITLHSFVCRGSLARRLRFEESLDAFEDWEFLARADLDGARLRRVPEPVCEYRVFPAEGQPNDLEAIHRARGYLASRGQVQQLLAQRLDASAIRHLMEFATDANGRLQRMDLALQQAHAARDAARADATQMQSAVDEAAQWATLLAPSSMRVPPVALAGQAFANGPRFCVLVPVCDPDPSFLVEAVESVLQQSYPNWELCLADDASTLAPVLHLLDRIDELAANDPRLKLRRRATRGGIVASTRDAVAVASCEWLVFLDHDDRLHPDALLEMARAIREAPQATAVYTDSRTIDRNGVVLSILRKPAWAPETMLHINYINHLSAIHRDAYDACGGLTVGSDGSQDWDIWLKVSRMPGFHCVHVPVPLYDWRANENSVAYAPQTKPYALEAARVAVQDHLEQLGLQEVETKLAIQSAGVRHQWQAPLQPLTAIILTHGNPADLEVLLDNLRGSAYPQLEVIVVANRVAPGDLATQRLLGEVRSRAGWRVLADDREFNWAALNNAAAARATTPWLLFLNDDVAIPQPDDLPRLAAWLTLDKAIGAVGARLTCSDEHGGSLQHDGIVTDPVLIALNITLSTPTNNIGIPRNVSAVTGACLLTPRAAFERCGGFDERLAVSYNDVDYCLHLRCLGYRIFQASDVTLIHHEARTRGPMNAAGQERQRTEAELMRSKWRDFLHERQTSRLERLFASTSIHHIPA